MRRLCSVTVRPLSIGDGAPEQPARDGLPLPGRTVPDVESQLCYRVLGPCKNRARSVLHWAGLTRDPPGLLRDTAARFGTTDRAIGQRVQRVEAAGQRLPLNAALELEVTRPSLPGESHLVRKRLARLLGRSVVS